MYLVCVRILVRQRLLPLLLLLVLHFDGREHVVDAVAPPLHDHWESVAAYRRRMNQTHTHSYRPNHLASWECKYLTDTECQRQDDYQAHIVNERLRLRRELQDSSATHTNVTSTPLRHSTRQRRLIDAPRRGDDLNVLVLLICFADHVDRPLGSREYFDAMFNGDDASSSVKVNPVGSIKDWLYYNSMGRYKVTFDVQDWFTVSEPEAYYAQGVSGFRGADEIQDMFKPALDALYNGGTYDFGTLESGGWGVLDHLVIVHSGYGAEFGDPTVKENCTFNLAKDRLWSRGYGSSLLGWQSSDYVYGVSNFAFAGAFDPDFCQLKPAQMGILTHEFMHGFNVIDLYDQDADEESVYLGGVGKFDIMGSTWGWRRNIGIPGHLSPFSRNAVGWIEPIEITQNGMYAIQASEFSNQIYVIRQNYPPGEYLYIENRQPVKWDKDWPTGGLVIYHIDDLAPKQTQRGYPGHGQWPTHHYQVAVIQADGQYKIEKGESPGDEGDFWTQGMTLKPSSSSMDGSLVVPNTDSYQGGIVQSTGIEISVTSPSRFIMSFTVKGLTDRTSRTFVVSTPTDTTAGGDTADAATTTSPTTTGGTLAWITSMLGGLAALIGVVALVLVVVVV